MSPGALLLILLSVACSAVAQLLFRLGMLAVSRQDTPAGAALPQHLLVTLSNPYILGGFMLYGIGALVWLSVLSRIEVSTAYPFVGLGFVLTALMGVGLLGESLSVAKFAGIALIVLGVILIGR